MRADSRGGRIVRNRFRMVRGGRTEGAGLRPPLERRRDDPVLTSRIDVTHESGIRLSWGGHMPAPRWIPACAGMTSGSGSAPLPRCPAAPLPPPP